MLAQKEGITISYYVIWALHDPCKENRLPIDASAQLLDVIILISFSLLDNV